MAQNEEKRPSDPVVDLVDILTPETISSRLIALGEECDAVAVVAADHRSLVRPSVP
ncbi:hypothetical protein [Mesorhizobium sp. B4-1-3]|uniref:hypothetical protein n=1 Tax=Mesorhizobium sp. B4-1-3 TaxID=2589889 RepID=UPI001FEFAD2C|nr:hypothetical protein [Mesorhizobium sp. B4-1-3]